VPEGGGSSVPPALLAALRRLPRLQHLHLACGPHPADLLRLTQLTGLKTLAINYSGPPALSQGLLAALHDGCGGLCRVQLWEQLTAQDSSGSFGGAAAAAGNGAAPAAGADAAGGVAAAGALAGAWDAPSEGGQRRARLAAWWRRRPRLLRALLPTTAAVFSGCMLARVTSARS
jgi:hypothetical protein